MVPTQLTSKRRRSAVDAACRYPWVEGLLGHRTIQPFIHSTSITIRHNGIEEHYYLFCQNHCRLPLNNSVVGPWRGDIIVMRKGKDICGVVDVRSRDANQVDQVVNA